MTTFAEATEAIYDYIIAGWNTNDAVLTFENESFVPPDNTPFIRVTLQHLSSTQETLGPVGGRNWQRNGEIVCQIFTNQNIGRNSADVLTGLLRTLLEGVKLTAGSGSVYLLQATPQEIGVDGNWFQLNVSVGFVYYERR